MSQSLSTSDALTGLHGFPLWAWGPQQHLLHQWLLKLNRRAWVPQTDFKTKIWLQAQPCCLIFCFHVDLGITQPLLGLGPVATFEPTFSSCHGEEERSLPLVPADVVGDPFSTCFMEWCHWSAVAGHGSSLDARGVKGCPSSHNPQQCLWGPEGISA